MKMKPDCNTFKFALFLVLIALRSSAQTNSPASSTPPEWALDDNFSVGWHEVQLGSGVYFSNIYNAPNRPKIDYAVGFAQAGYMITKPGEDSWYRGSLEVAPEIFGAGIYHGPGTYITGATLWFRYNFVQPGCKFVPYFQLGGGGTVQDLPHTYDGKDFNFNLGAAAGVHYFIRPKLALNVEYRFQHISNADLWDHNIGSNADGPMVGVSVFF
jgi:opacity protein-like surface antigen